MGTSVRYNAPHLAEQFPRRDVIPALSHFHPVDVEREQHVRVQRFLEQAPDPQSSLALVRVLRGEWGVGSGGDEGDDAR